jgi:hypothetical protein
MSSHESLSSQQRLEAIAHLFAVAFLRQQPGPLARLRRAAEACENNSVTAPISLDKGSAQSVHATVNSD